MSSDSGASLAWDQLPLTSAADRAFAEDLLRTFLRHLPAQRRTLTEAVAAADSAQIALAVHSLKGALLAIGAHPATAQAGALETLARQNRGGDSTPAWQQLEEQLTRLKAEIESRLG